MHYAAKKGKRDAFDEDIKWNGCSFSEHHIFFERNDKKVFWKAFYS